MELARIEAQKKASWLHRFRKDKHVASAPKALNGSRRGSTVSNTSDKNRASASVEDLSSAGGVSSGAAMTRSHYDDYDNDDLPPRMDSKAKLPYQSGNNLGSRASSDVQLPIISDSVTSPPDLDRAQDFNLRQIREEIAKDDGSGQLLASSRAMTPSLTETRTNLTSSRLPVDAMSSHVGSRDLNRTDTAPSLPTYAQRQKEQIAKEKQELMYEAQQAADCDPAQTPQASSTSFAFESNPFSDPQASQHPSSSAVASSASPTAFPPHINSFQTSSSSSLSAPFSFPLHSHTNGALEPSISYGDENGRISFDNSDTGLEGSPWNDDSNGLSTNPFAGKFTSDPWSSTGWSSATKW